MRNKFFKPLLAIACLLSSTNVSAYDFEVDGVYYDVVSLNELTCEVVEGKQYKYKGDIVIPSTVNYNGRAFTVVEIAATAFRGCSELTGITIPNTIKTLYSNSFDRCTKLERVIIEDGEETLKVNKRGWLNTPGDEYWQWHMFYCCPIKTLYLGRNLSYDAGERHWTGDTYYWAYYAPFHKIQTLTEVTIGNSVTEIGSRAFYGCTGLTSVTIGNSVTTIGASAFEECYSLLYVPEGKSVTHIGARAFYKCIGLTNVTIGDPVATIGQYAFFLCI